MKIKIDGYSENCKKVKTLLSPIKENGNAVLFEYRNKKGYLSSKVCYIENIFDYFFKGIETDKKEVFDYLFTRMTNIQEQKSNLNN